MASRKNTAPSKSRTHKKSPSSSTAGEKTSSERFQVDEDNYLTQDFKTESKSTESQDEDTPRRSTTSHIESWSEDIDEDIESPRTTPRHPSTDQSSKPKGRNTMRAGENQTWDEEFREEAEFDELDEDISAASANTEEDEEKEEDLDDQTDHRSHRHPH